MLTSVPVLTSPPVHCSGTLSLYPNTSLVLSILPPPPLPPSPSPSLPPSPSHYDVYKKSLTLCQGHSIRVDFLQHNFALLHTLRATASSSLFSPRPPSLHSPLCLQRHIISHCYCHTNSYKVCRDNIYLWDNYY